LELIASKTKTQVVMGPRVRGDDALKRYTSHNPSNTP
jgi:hypothetical protein